MIPPEDAGPTADLPGAAEIETIFAAAVARWAAACHGRVDDFARANFSLAGTFRLHRRAFGLDLLRAPANVALVPVHLLIQLAASGLGRMRVRSAARWLRRRNVFLATSVARELVWRLHVDLLGLPCRDRARESTKDALAEALLADPALAARFGAASARVLRHRDDPLVRQRLGATLDTYTGARTAAAELVNNMMLAGAGASAFQKLTPGALSLGPLLAGLVAQHLAIASFPLGASLGSLWYGVVVAQPSAALVAGVTAGLMLGAAMLTAFAGIVSDPLQRALGLHQRRLHRLIDALARQLGGDGEASLRLRDHYAARLFDVIDALNTAARLAG
ncbi:MAG: hypothetical protein IPK66_15260 [Rhodospirillales bacterium]|nr:hypothetical protein [Rhodospirillales bacterium]